MSKKKAVMSLEQALERTGDRQGIEKPVTQLPKVKQKNKKQVPIYYDPKLHDALQTIVFVERKKGTSINSLVLEGLTLLFKERGYPSIAEIVSGEKTINV